MKTLQMLLVLLLAAGMVVAQDAATETAAGVYNDGLAALKGKNYADALEKMSKAIEIADPEADAKVVKLAKQNGAIAAYYTGNGLLKEKKFDEAMAMFDRGIELNEKYYTNYYGKAKCKDDQDMTADAVAGYIKAAEVATAAGKADRAEKYMGRAANIIGVAFGAKKYDDAVAAGETYLATHESVDVSYYVAKSLIEKGKPSDAIAHATKASEAGGTAEEGKYILVLAEAYEAAGNKSAASETYGKVPQGKYYKHAQYRAGELQK